MPLCFTDVFWWKTGLGDSPGSLTCLAVPLPALPDPEDLAGRAQWCPWHSALLSMLVSTAPLQPHLPLGNLNP